MNDPQTLREISWRRRLTAAEEAALRESSSGQAGGGDDLELDAALTESLNRLPDAPVSSNFTARVLAAVERETRADERRQARRWNWRRWFPRVAFAASGVLTIVAAMTLVSHQRQAEARDMAQGIATVTSVKSLPSPEVLQDFEAIRRLNSTPAPDEQLLALFQ